MRLFIIEDDADIAKRIENICNSDSFICHTSESGIDAVEMVQLYDYAAIILDLMLPDMDGFEVLKRIRSIRNNTPVIILSGISMVDEKVKCFSLGADDYITKPFSKSEFLARVHAVVRRSAGHSSSVIEAGSLSIDIKGKDVKICGNPFPVTNKEYAILELLALKRGSVLPKDAFLNHMYGGIDEPEAKIIDVLICKLRKKMADASGGINFIETVWGRGYALKDFSGGGSIIERAS